MNLAFRIGPGLAVMLLAAGLAQAQQICPAGDPHTTPDSDFADAGNGTVLHLPTGLIWKRCAEGQTWNGSTCTGAAAGYAWQQAFQRADAVNAGMPGTQNAGFTDWRVPNLKELRSIVERGCNHPSINLTQFPATPALFFWSGSPDAGHSGGAWGVLFEGGNGDWFSRSLTSRVRLVRAGQYFHNFDPMATAAAITSGTPPGGTVGTPYPAFTVTATGTAPIAFSAAGLPPGLAIDPASAVISGTPTAAGSYNVTITATNAGGETPLNVTIVIVGAAATTPTSIPTLSEWGLMILAALLAITGKRSKSRPQALPRACQATCNLGSKEEPRIA